MKDYRKKVTQIERLLDKKQKIKGLALAHRLLRHHPHDLVILERLTRTLIKAEDLVGAEAALDYLRQENPPEKGPIYYLAAKIAQQQKQRTKAVQAARKALELGFLTDFYKVECYGILCEDAEKYRGDLEEAAAYQKKIFSLYETGKVVEKDSPGWRGAVTTSYTNFLFQQHYLPHPQQVMYARARKYQSFFDDIVPFQTSLAEHQHERIRVGYISPDFRPHVVLFFCFAFFVHYHQERFSVYAYANCAENTITDWMIELGVHVRIVEKDTPEEIARRIKADEIDILVDLAGHTGNTGLPALAYRPAPVQMTGVGYFDTTGLDAVDYFLTDVHCDPVGQNDAYFTERLLRLPESHFNYIYRDTEIPPIKPLAAERNGHVTFGSFNNSRKLNDEVLKTWARILAAVPEAQLYLKDALYNTSEGREAMTVRLERAGIQISRVRMERTEQEYHHCYEDMDIALDPWPYPGGGTTCDALYMGVPVVTLVGESHHRRFGYSLLKNVGLEELCAWNEEEYVEKAVALAHDLPRLNRLHQTLRAQMEQSPVMNGPRYMRNLEAAYTRIYGYWQDKQRVQEAARRRRPVLALTDEALPLLAAAFGEDVSSLSAERAAAMLDAQGIRLLMLGSERNLQLALPYDVTTHVYLFLLDGYPALRDALTEAGLVEHEQFFDGHCLLGGHPWISELRFGGAV